MKLLLAIVVLAVSMQACGGSARFRGQVRDIIPQRAGNFTLAGEIKPMEMPPPDKYRSGAARPTEGANAQYELAGRTRVSLQLVNFASGDDAGVALKKMQDNIESLQSGAKVSESAKTNKAGKATGRRLVVENFQPGIHQIIWNDGSLFYAVSGDDLKLLTEFEQSLP
jgi:hypothetical protein